MPRTLTLLRQGHPLADPRRQLQILEADGRGGSFLRTLAHHGQGPLTVRADLRPANQRRQGLQPDVPHCHVDAGPDRREVMSRETMAACLRLRGQSAESRRWISPAERPSSTRISAGWSAEARGLGARVIDRCNLTVLLTPGQQDLPEFLAGHQRRGRRLASLLPRREHRRPARRRRATSARSRPCAGSTRWATASAGTGLALTLVFNPIGPSFLRPRRRSRPSIDASCSARHGVEFTRLFTITNMPISRFLDDLIRSGEYERYMETLIGAFNPAAVAGVMCRTTLSVGWDGRLFDCDFNQMLELPLAPECLGKSASLARKTWSDCSAGGSRRMNIATAARRARGRAARGRSRRRNRIAGSGIRFSGLGSRDGNGTRNGNRKSRGKARSSDEVAGRVQGAAHHDGRDGVGGQHGDGRAQEGGRVDPAHPRQPAPGAPLQQAEADIRRDASQGRQGDHGDQARAEPDQPEENEAVQEIGQPGRAAAPDVGHAPGRDAHAHRCAEGPRAEVGDTIGAELRVGIGGSETRGAGPGSAPPPAR